MILPALAKLVMVLNGSMAVVEYPTQQRCEAARAAVEREIARRAAEARRNLQPGAILVELPLAGVAFCLPD